MRKSVSSVAVEAFGLALVLLCAGCANSGANNSGGEIVGGILQGIGAGLSGL